MLLWLQLLLCLAVIGYAGYFLSRYGDIIAEKSGISASWVGLILLATTTSLPELVTGISAVTFANAPNIAVGDVLGSTVFNLAFWCCWMRCTDAKPCIAAPLKGISCRLHWAQS